MTIELSIKILHAFLATLSGVYFGCRGLWRLGLGRPIRHVIWRQLPHAADTLLLLTGITLAILLQTSPHASPWLATKLVLVVFYIALGIFAFRSRTGWIAWSCFVAALATWVWILGIALYKHPAGWFA